MRTTDSRARVLALGPARGPATAASGRAAPVWTAGDHPVFWRSLERRIQKRISAHRCDVVHLTDVALAPFGRWFRSRTDIPVTIDVAPADLLAGGDAAERIFAAVDALDAAFVLGAAGDAALCRRTRRVAVSALPLIAVAAPDEPLDAPDAVGSLLGDVPPARPIAVVPWTDDRTEIRWFTEEVIAAFSDVLWLIAGIPAGPEPAACPFDRASIRLHHAQLDDPTIATLARYADAFVVPWHLGGGAPDADALLRLALAASATPVIAADEGDCVLEHEQNAFTVRARDGAGFRATLDQLFTLPARQRHYIGEEFAEDVIARWPVAAAAAAYEDRFELLAGHPAIPAELRVA